MSKMTDSNSSGIVRGVTSQSTVMHWVLYAMDAWEAENPADRRENGCKPHHVWDLASGGDEESIVFRGIPEIRFQMKQLAEERGALARRTDETGWHEDDVDWYYRLNEEGRRALLDLGVPDYLPNRYDPEHDRGLPMEPTHAPGWWLDDDDQPDYDVEDGWQLADNDWIQSDEHESVYFFNEADRHMAEGRGYTKFGEELAEAFPEATFVITSGPYRMHDLMYRIRDPFNKVIQIDVYSPMAMHRENDEVVEAFTNLVTDLHEALKRADEEIVEDDDG